MTSDEHFGIVGEVPGAWRPLDQAAIARFGQPQVDAVTQSRSDLQGLATGTAGLVSALDDLALVLRDQRGGRADRSGWWDRLLGRDVEQAEHLALLRERAGVLLHRVCLAADGLAAVLGERQADLLQLEASLRALDDVNGQLPPPAGESVEPVLRQAMLARQQHLARVVHAGCLDLEQRRLMQEQVQSLLRHVSTLRDILLPVLRQQSQAQTVGDVAEAMQAALSHQSEIARLAAGLSMASAPAVAPTVLESAEKPR